jgi:hypothetical protein
MPITKPLIAVSALALSTLLMGCLASPDDLEDWSSNTRAITPFTYSKVGKYPPEVAGNGFNTYAMDGHSTTDDQDGAEYPTLTGTGTHQGGLHMFANGSGGLSSKVVIVMDGNGACWNSCMCNKNNGFTTRQGKQRKYIFKDSYNNGNDSAVGKNISCGQVSDANFSTPFNVPDIVGPHSPYCSGGVVTSSLFYVPNTTGDANVGNATVNLPAMSFQGLTNCNAINNWHFNGWNNAQAALNDIHDKYYPAGGQHPITNLVIRGTSSGGIASTQFINMVETIWSDVPNLDIVFIDDSGVAIGTSAVPNVELQTQPWVDGPLSIWNATATFPYGGDKGPDGHLDAGDGLRWESKNGITTPPGHNVRWGGFFNQHDWVINYFAMLLGAGRDTGGGGCQNTTISGTPTINQTPSNVNVASTSGFPQANSFMLSHGGVWYTVNYTGITGNTFNGCTLASGSVTASNSDQVGACDLGSKGTRLSTGDGCTNDLKTSSGDDNTNARMFTYKTADQAHVVLEACMDSSNPCTNFYFDNFSSNGVMLHDWYSKLINNDTSRGNVLWTNFPNP